jgi:hypothetical protein
MLIKKELYISGPASYSAFLELLEDTGPPKAI